MGKRKPRDPVPPGYKEVFTPYIVHRRTGRRIYPKRARVFRLVVRA
jgi:hypothetical protein